MVKHEQPSLGFKSTNLLTTKLRADLPEVRNAAKFALSTALGPLTAEAKAALLAQFMQALGSGEVLFGCLGIGALVESENDWVDPWKGEALNALVATKLTSPDISSAVVSTINEFWKRHKGNWEYYRTFYTPEQLEKLEEFRSIHSYFAQKQR